MVRIEHFSVKGYKNISDADVSFNNFNVIIGPNNAGKSNFLQSISFLDFIINGASDEVERHFKNGFYRSLFNDLIPFQHLDSRYEDRIGSIDFLLRFSNSETKAAFEYRLSLGYEDGIIESNFSIRKESLELKEYGKPGKAVNLFNRNEAAIKYGASLPRIGIHNLPSHLSVIGVLKLFPIEEIQNDAINSLNKVLKTPIFYFSNTELLKSDVSDRLNVFNGRTIAFDIEQEIVKMQETNRWAIFCSALRDVLNIDMVKVITYQTFEKSGPVNKRLTFEQFNTRKSIKQFSDGTILILALITKVLNSDHDIFFIEEPENSTHPKALVDLVNFLQSFSENKQFVITSHSIPILNKTKIDDVIIATIAKNGLSEFRNVKSQKELKTRLKSAHINFSDELFFASNEEEFE